jgi:hypothetical protein
VSTLGSSCWQAVQAFVSIGISVWLAALPCGLVLGMMYAPLRLSGVDFGKGYRDPAEPNEGDDRS